MLVTKPKIGVRVVCWLSIVLVAYAMYLSRMKTGIVLVAICPIVYLVFHYRWILWGFYSSAIVFMTFLFTKASYLRDNIAQYDRAFRGFLDLSETYSIQTFEARLNGYAKLSDPNRFSLFGLDGEVKTHDILTIIYLKLGLIPVLAGLIAGLYIVYKLHHLSFLLPKGEWRNLYIAGLTFFSTGMAANIFGGSNLHSTPWNVLLWLNVSICAFAWFKGRGQTSLNNVSEVNTQPIY